MPRLSKLGVMLSLLGATVACGVGGAGCAEEKAPIVRVQPNALSKSYFVGGDIRNTADDPEFFWRAYVVDNAASASWVTVGTWNHVDRIKWEISEDMLIARKSYPLLPGADAHALPGNTDGTVVAAYKISSHFDIRRAYNPSTGEEQNVIEENRDRPWYDREYFRVDWSTNMVQDPMGENWFASMQGALTFTPLTYTVTDPTSQDAPHFEPDYFDITNRYYVAPANTRIWGFDIPACFLTGIFFGANSYECDAQESTVRFSFMRTNDEEQDFEPLENTKASLDVVGNPGGIGTSGDVSVVTPGREGFDPSFGYLDKNFHSFANIHNIWKKSHVAQECASKGDADHNGTDDECEGAAATSGSQCDVFAKKCTIPYREREVRTVGYWVNRDFPADLQDTLDEGGAPIDRGAAEDIIFSWNQLMKAAVGYAREVECRRTGDGDRASCHTQFFDGKEMVSFGGWLTDKSVDQTPVLTLCHNPVRSYDLPMCGAEGFRARDSDLRKNWLIYWPYSSRAPYGGIANWNGDPLTGRIIGGAALTMGPSTTRGAAFARDVLQLAIGDITATDYFDGVPTETYARRLRAGFAAAPGLDAETIDKRVASNDAVHAANTIGLRPLDGASVQEKFGSFLGYQAKTTFDQASEAAMFASLTQRTAAGVGSSIESDLLSPMHLATSIGVRPGTPAGGLAPLASPLSLGDVTKQKVLQQIMRNHAERNGMCFLESDMAPIGSISLPGLGKYFLDKYPGDPKARGEAIYQELVRETFKGIALHEVGHSLGMLHQFASSWDSMNYEPQYWQLRTNEGQNTASCGGKLDASGACLGPRYLDPQTADEMGHGAESRPGIDYFANTSTMEYQAERFGETAGLGSYDQHTMKALYGRVIEVMDDSVTSVAEQRDFAPRMRTQLNDQDVIMRSSAVAGGAKFAQPIHYTELARAMKRFDPARDCRDATDEEKATAKWRIIHGKVCSHTPKDHAAWQDLRSDAYDGATTAIQWHVDPASKAAPDRVRWFYRWGSTDNSYVHTNPSDAGADIYEATVFTGQQFDALYPYLYLRGHRREWAFWRLPSRALETTFERTRTYHWNVAMRSAQFRQSFGAAEFDKISASDDWHRPYLLANVEAFNLLARAVLIPQPGGYSDTKSRALPGWTKKIYDTDGSNDGKFFIEAGVGRYVDTEVDNDLEKGGGSWDYNEWTKRTGYSDEKGLAVAALVNGRPPVFAPTADIFLDPRSQQLNFYADMPLGVERLLAGVMSHDWQSVGMSGRASVDNPISMLDLLAPTVQRDPSDVAVFPNIGYDQQLYIGLYAMLLAGESTDLSLTNKMRVWVDGLDGPISTQAIPDLSKQVRFTDPRTGFTYIARKYGSEDPERPTADRGMAARMLGYANAHVANVYVLKSDTPDQFGRPDLELDAQGQPQPKNPNVQNTAYREFVKYVGLIDTVRQLGFWFGQGPL